MLLPVIFYLERCILRCQQQANLSLATGLIAPLIKDLVLLVKKNTVIKYLQNILLR